MTSLKIVIKSEPKHPSNLNKSNNDKLVAASENLTLHVTVSTFRCAIIGVSPVTISTAECNITTC